MLPEDQIDAPRRGIFDRLITRLFEQPEVVIAYTLVAAFCGAYFRRPTDQLEGALIVAFTSASAFYLGTTVGAQRAASQVGEGLGLTRAALRGMARAKDDKS
ncbi:hypothetical protein GVO57_07505 [Sphingomonas changnyeongensis]|uniref:Uncharacterized protein n=1 Tax=Sphingomonas changnyeongensis TaxID=2698679 RepID=A0A7Z2NVR4_9SPHN|nr:hypothetical protein [Sphingomonas changnyeongensis]QHL90711.1 hypothetical protein GVO57_07505 [Sphingomonas changnyeongensis]